MSNFTNDYLLDKQVKIYQPTDGYRASTDAVFLSSLVDERKLKNGTKILDVGSGTGAISLCLASRMKDKDVKIKGLDIQKELVELSNQSAKANNFQDILSYENFDIREDRKEELNSYDIVITNPPYSDHDMPSPNESKKLAHNHQNFDLTGWLIFCIKMLKSKGELYLINRAEAINEILLALHNRAGDIRILPLYSKYGQDAKRVVIIAKRGARGVTKILPPFYVHNQDGSYTDAAQKILRMGKNFFDEGK